MLDHVQIMTQLHSQGTERFIHDSGAISAKEYQITIRGLSALQNCGDNVIRQELENR